MSNEGGKSVTHHLLIDRPTWKESIGNRAQRQYSFLLPTKFVTISTHSAKLQSYLDDGWMDGRRHEVLTMKMIISLEDEFFQQLYVMNKTCNIDDWKR